MININKLPGRTDDTRIIFAGLPFDHNSSFMKGPADAPPKIREALFSSSSTMWSESGIDLGEKGLVVDAGDLGVSVDGAFTAIGKLVNSILDSGAVPFFLGGDHSVTWPIFEALNTRVPRIDILHFDAHPDLYDNLDDNRESHACPFARIMEKGTVGRLVQVGIRSTTGHQIEQAARFGVETISMQEIHSADGSISGLKEKLIFDNPLYISFDIDALDPAFAPGVSHFEPGGLTSRQAISFIQSLSAPSIAGADIVEYNPDRDRSDVTAYLCAKIFKEIAARIIAPG
ncbi:MAG: agmatinase [Bacteroidales bacterium]|nr:agmatinase [Candidatus Latescibacterota bacterium]